jgi:hypothetical protein
MWSVLAFLQIVDVITGKVVKLMVLILALNVHCELGDKNKVM